MAWDKITLGDWCPLQQRRGQIALHAPVHLDFEREDKFSFGARPLSAAHKLIETRYAEGAFCG